MPPETLHSGPQIVGTTPPIRPKSAVVPVATNVPAAATVHRSGLWKLGFAFVLLDLFCTYSRLPELMAIWIGSNLAIARISRLGGFAAAVATGGAFQAFSSRIGFGLGAFTVWAIICTPFSAWKGGSVAMLTTTWIPVMFGFVAVNGMMATIKDVCRSIYVLVAASFFIVVVSRSFGGGDRMAFDLGTLANSNDLATLVLLGIPPTVLFFQLNPRRYFMIKLALVATTPFMLAIVMRTASRGALLNLFVMCAIAFLTTSVYGKIKILFATLVLMVCVVLFAPREALARYVTMLPFVADKVITDGETASIAGSAAASSDTREHMLKESIALTFKNPIFGVGPGVFITGVVNEAEQRGERPIWLASHNGYTQVSSETGLPGLFFYLMSFVSCFTFTIGIRNRAKRIPQMQHIVYICNYLLMALSCMALNYMLGSIAYLAIFPLLAAMTDGFRRAANAELNAFRFASAAAVAAGSAQPVTAVSRQFGRKL